MDRYGTMPPVRLQAQAYAELEGVGDESLGYWEEWARAFHLRRRLSASEQERVGPAVDIRGTPEVSVRLYAVRKWLPQGWTE